LREELKKSAEIRVRGKVVLKAVAEAEKLKISDKEFNDEVGAMARASGREEQELKKTMDEHMQEYINDYLLRKKALDFILEKAKITEVEKPLQTSQTEEEIK
jgi:trigger factor